jgi:hypothetical protein
MQSRALGPVAPSKRAARFERPVRRAALTIGGAPSAEKNSSSVIEYERKKGESFRATHGVGEEARKVR